MTKVHNRDYQQVGEQMILLHSVLVTNRLVGCKSEDPRTSKNILSQSKLNRLASVQNEVFNTKGRKEIERNADN
jgi:hypothetical protein